MIIIEVQKGESIDKALKRYKFKVSKTRQMEKLRNRQEFTKKSVEKREKKQKAIYLQKKNGQEL
jgi:small subunit ribosomal protein S21